MESEPPRPPGHVSALINAAHYMDQICLDPQDKLPLHSPPLGHIVNKTPSPPPDKKLFAPPPRIISGTALRIIQKLCSFCSVVMWFKISGQSADKAYGK